MKITVIIIIFKHYNINRKPMDPIKSYRYQKGSNSKMEKLIM